MMTKDDKAEIIEIFTDCIKTVVLQQETKQQIENERTNNQLDLIRMSISELAKDVNESKLIHNRVAVIEKAIIEHPQGCPIAPKVRALEDVVLENKAIRNFKNFIYATIGALIGSAATIITIVKFIIK